MSLRLRIALVVAGVVAVVVAGVGYSVHRSTERSLIAAVDADLLDRALVVQTRGPGRPGRFDAEGFRDFERGALFGAQRADPFLGLVEFDAFARVIDADGDVSGVLDAEFEASTDAVILEAAASAPVLHDGTSDAGRVRVVTVGLADIGFLQLARPLDEVDSVLADLRLETGLIGGLAIATAALAGWFIASAMSAPIRRLTDVAEHVAQTGDLSQPVVGSGQDEVGRLAASVRTMLTALSDSRRQQHQLVMDASHELRTPLTSLRTNVDVLRSGHELAPADREALLDDLDVELGELSDLVSELVDLATDLRSDEEVAPVTLRELVEPVAERARRRTGRAIEITVARTVVVEGRPDALSRAVRNLIDNAAKFSPSDTPILVEIDAGAVTVHDHGPGIPEAERSAVFDRFHRVESSRSLPGSGLGLSIVRQVAEAHDGSVSAGVSSSGGAAVGFRLPTVDDI